MKTIVIIIKIIYFLIPKFIRSQYEESILFYKDIIQKIKRKIVYKINNKNQIFAETLELELVENIEALDCEYEELFQKKHRSSSINKPKISIDNQNFFKSELSSTVPDIFIYRLKNVQLVGHTDAILYNDCFFHIELNLMDYYHDLKRPEIFSKQTNGMYNVTINYQKKSNSFKYISLLKEHSINYFHWATEAIPRLILILDILKKESTKFDLSQYTILIDEGLPKQCIEMIELLIKVKTNITFLKKGESFLAEEVIYCTPLWHSLDNTMGLPNPKKEFFVDKYALEIVRENILNQYNLSEEFTYNFKKIYLQRLNTKLRPITNLNEVELILFKNGFEFIDVGSLNLHEQIELFQNADVVIGASGAAFTNLLFMKKGAKAINFYPSASATNYYVFQPLADVAGVDLTHFLTIPKKGETSVHGEVSINLEDLKLFLKDEK